jgi:hypothetical protein
LNSRTCSVALRIFSAVVIETSIVRGSGRTVVYHGVRLLAANRDFQNHLSGPEWRLLARRSLASPSARTCAAAGCLPVSGSRGPSEQTQRAVA